MDIRFSLCLPRDEVSVPVVRHLCGDALTSLGVAQGCVSDIELALTEACTNVLKHAAGTHEDYEVAVEVDESKCAIRVVDTGRGFDTEAWPDDRDGFPLEGGRGIELMRALVDDLHFVSRPHEGTAVYLEKSLTLSEGSILGMVARAPDGSVVK